VHPGAVSVLSVEAIPRNDAGKVSFRALDDLCAKVLA